VSDDDLDLDLDIDVRAMRIARPSRDLAAALTFYVGHVGLQHLGGFDDHDGYDGVFIGLPGAGWHIELTRHVSGEPEPCPTEEDLLVLYLAVDEVTRLAARLRRHGHEPVAHPNPYWARAGAVSFRDPDGYVLILSPDE
jgi:catechol 2,3-dioxygenase-like lactoylglutathione lyase family enzyme